MDDVEDHVFRHIAGTCLCTNKQTSEDVTALISAYLPAAGSANVSAGSVSSPALCLARSSSSIKALSPLNTSGGNWP
jgi:hypothetical protein